jgi:hypothetical protein
MINALIIVWKTGTVVSQRDLNVSAVGRIKKQRKGAIMAIGIKEGKGAS